MRGGDTLYVWVAVNDQGDAHVPVGPNVKESAVLPPLCPVSVTGAVPSPQLTVTVGLA